MTKRKQAKLFDAILDAHIIEAARRTAEITNLGWATTDTGIASKTSKGILDTECRNGIIEHTWVRR
jgi:hypothetical protein